MLPEAASGKKWSPFCLEAASGKQVFFPEAASGKQLFFTEAASGEKFAFQRACPRRITRALDELL